jgi:hypothetical protein
MRPAIFAGKSGKSDFFSNKPERHQPPHQHIDIRKPPQKYTYAQSFDQSLTRSLAALDATTKSLIQQLEASTTELKTAASNLPETYKKRQAAQSGFFSYFRAAPPLPEEISFIMSIIASLKVEVKPVVDLKPLMQHTTRTLNTLKDSILQKTNKQMMQIIDGAYLSVMEKIEKPYRDAWFSTDASVDPLFAELSKRVGPKTTAEKIACLTALQNHLKTPTAKAAVNFGSHSAEVVLADIAEQLDSLSQCSSENGVQLKV